MSTTLKNPEAKALKEEGNRAYQDGKYQEAVDAYTKALDKEFDKSLLLNRSQAYLKLEKWGFAYVDASETLRHHPDDVKGLVRRAHARMELGFEEGAVDDLEKAKKLTPGDSKILELLEQAKVKLKEAQEELQRLIEQDEKASLEELERLGLIN